MEDDVLVDVLVEVEVVELLVELVVMVLPSWEYPGIFSTPPTLL